MKHDSSWRSKGFGPLGQRTVINVMSSSSKCEELPFLPHRFVHRNAGSAVENVEN
jgi:hypothetical protein